MIEVRAGSTARRGKSELRYRDILVLITIDSSSSVLDLIRSGETYIFLFGPVAAQDPDLGHSE